MAYSYMNVVLCLYSHRNVSYGRTRKQQQAAGSDFQSNRVTKQQGHKAAGSDFQKQQKQQRSSRVRLSNFNLPKSSRKSSRVKAAEQQGQTFKFASSKEFVGRFRLG